MISLTAPSGVRTDKLIVWVIFSAAIGWIGCEAAYRVQDLGPLRWRSDELSQVQQAIAPRAPLPTVVKAVKQLKKHAAKVDCDGG